ncbi:unnamed protein product [Rhizoctonia solani]|uniref:Uncharacterized protein n=1 Tax=Rhizoctonia solani TaxID=456999 RepID=A0A8H3GKF7_9AGAM|nr:unnamed protein product [Rhizoctonia solani]
MSSYPAAAYIVLVLSTLFICLRLLGRPKTRHPPCPKSYPLIGSVLSIPPEPEQLAFMKLGRQLNSDIIFLKLFGRDFIVLNSAEAASETLDKRSAIYSDRVFPPMISDSKLMDWSKSVAAIGYGDQWRHYRRMLNEWLNIRAVSQFEGLQKYHVQLMLRRLLNITESSKLYEDVKESFF